MKCRSMSSGGSPSSGGRRVDTAPGKLDGVDRDVGREDADWQLLALVAEEIGDEHGERSRLLRRWRNQRTRCAARPAPGLR